MATVTTGDWLVQYVEPQLLDEFKNYKDDFIASLRGANKSAVDKDGIRFNKLINNVEFYVNKKTEFIPKKMTGQKTLVEWDKMDTSPTMITDAELRAMAYDKESEVRKKHQESFRIGVRDYVLRKLSPTKNAINTPVIRTTGEDDKKGRKRLTYSDLVNFHVLLEQMNLKDPNGWNLVLSAEHKGDLILDKGSTSNYRDVKVNEKTGVIDKFYKIKLFENNDVPLYDNAGNLKSDGALAIPTDRKASIFFYSPNTVYHIDQVRILYKPMDQDTRSADPTSEIRLHVYGLCDMVQSHGFAALVSGIV